MVRRFIHGFSSRISGYETLYIVVERCSIMVKSKSKKSNTNLHKAKAEKNDEYYTQLSDIEKELGHYKKQFKNKIVYCNCDDSTESNFWQYFILNFYHLGLKKLIATHYEDEIPSYKLEVTSGSGIVKTPLKQNGDFRSDECIEILKEADIVVTNPPFSLFREYVAQLMEYNKEFIILGSMNALSYKEIFKLIKDDKLWLGYNTNRSALEFRVPKILPSKEGSTRIDNNGTKFVKMGNIYWYTNLDFKERHEDLILYKKYNAKDYPKYDNYDAINVEKTMEIPMDYAGVMGVPISFMDKYNPDQFEIVGQMVTTKIDEFNFGYPFINGEKIYARILIRNKRL